MVDAKKNFAVSAVATAPSPASSGTSLVVTAGHGTRFPAVPFNAVISPASTRPDPANSEVVRVTGIATDTLTIVRAQEGSAARTVVVGDQIAAAITARSFWEIEVPGIEVVNGNAWAQTRAGIQGAIDAVNAAGGGVVIIPPDTSITFDTTNLDMYSNVHLKGTRGSSIFKAPADSTVMNLIEFAGGYSSASDLNADAEIGATSVTLVAGGVAATGMAVGSICDLFDGTVGYNQNVRVIAISSETLTLSEPLAGRFDSATTEVYRLSSPVENMTIEGIKFDGNTNSGDGTRGILGGQLVNGVFRDLDFVDFNNAGAFVVGDSYGVLAENIRLIDCGDAGESDMQWAQNSMVIWNNVRSIDASGFGPQTIRCNWCQFNNIHISGSNGRGFKHQVLTFSEFNNIGVHGAANTYTGFSLADRSCDNVINNLIAIGNGAAGVWFEGAGECRNVFNNCRSQFNTTRDVEIPSTSNGNIFENFLYDAILDSSDGTTIINGVNVQTFTATGAGTWTKPKRGTRVRVEVWGAGGSGGRAATGDGGGGGGGGSYNWREFAIGDLSATESLSVGTGGAAVSVDNTDGNSGGNTTFSSAAKLVTGFGGGGGAFGTAGTGHGGGGGGGTQGAGTSATTTAGGAGGNPLGGAANTASTFGGGGGASTGSAGGASIYGGGGGGFGSATNTATAGGASHYGGGGGGGGADTADGAAGGASVMGGAGGAGHNAGVAGVAGTQPGGGGGGSEAANSGAGGNGKVVVTTW